jgi:hypothetical protein
MCVTSCCASWQCDEAARYWKFPDQSPVDILSMNQVHVIKYRCRIRFRRKNKNYKFSRI